MTTHDHPGNNTSDASSPAASPAHGASLDEVPVTISVRGLAERPYVGSGCCVLSAAAAIEQEMSTWPFVVTATVDETTSEVLVTMRSSDADLDALLEVLESMGYPAITEIAPD